MSPKPSEILSEYASSYLLCAYRYGFSAPADEMRPAASDKPPVHSESTALQVGRVRPAQG